MPDPPYPRALRLAVISLYIKWGLFLALAVIATVVLLIGALNAAGGDGTLVSGGLFVGALVVGLFGGLCFGVLRLARSLPRRGIPFWLGAIALELPLTCVGAMIALQMEPHDLSSVGAPFLFLFLSGAAVIAVLAAQIVARARGALTAQPAPAQVVGAPPVPGPVPAGPVEVDEDPAGDVYVQDDLGPGADGGLSAAWDDVLDDRDDAVD